MKFETKYNVGDKVWLRTKNIESYIQANPYKDQQKILESCFREGRVNIIKVETSIFDNHPIISYVISDSHLNKDEDPEDFALRQYNKVLFHSEQDVFSNFDEVTNMIKEAHKNVLNSLKHKAEEILKKYE
jgi:hypothetical protein